jgi:hypothetical protein
MRRYQTLKWCGAIQEKAEFRCGRCNLTGLAAQLTLALQLRLAAKLLA